MQVTVALSPLATAAPCGAEWLRRVGTEDEPASIRLAKDAPPLFLSFGGHAYAPDRYLAPDGKDLSHSMTLGEPVPLALFQGLTAQPLVAPDHLDGQEVLVSCNAQRDPFWDQVITVAPGAAASGPGYSMVEAGRTGSALTADLQAVHQTAGQIAAQQGSLTDPHIPRGVDRELPWEELAALAFPLDFQKVLVASPNDASPGFAYQNGQWLTTWLSRDLPKWTKEDHWFAPALLIGNELVRPAPLSARTGFVTTGPGITLPLWTLEWEHDGIGVRQWVFSHPARDGSPHLHVRLEVNRAPKDTRLALGVGRRPNAHYWDNLDHQRTPIPFLTLPPGYRRQGRHLVDGWDHLILESAQAFELEAIGPAEQLLTFTADKQGNVYLRMPQTESAPTGAVFRAGGYASARQAFEATWSRALRRGARATLPDAEWMRRIDIWHSQVEAITRVHYQGRERLSYGAYFYQAYFGPEEGWPIVALALWGRGEEAQRQAEIMLSAENRDKGNVHHQGRNGAFAWYAAEVARLSDDRAWLTSIAPALVENAEWTIDACASTRETGTPVTRGLLPPHIYGGDIRDPATSLYASAVCWKGLSETADVLRQLGPESLQKHARRYEEEARALNQRLGEVIDRVADRGTDPPFLPLALALPSRNGAHEGPYHRLTASRLGNYWNLFAPSVLELGLEAGSEARCPNRWLLGYMETHGGLWAGLPRFHHGLDAAYSIGVIKELITRSTGDVRWRNQALAGLQSFFLHAASRNGFTIPEVAGLFPYRLDAGAYEQLVRESPWSFGMYSTDRYIGGHLSFTEPLGAGAGEALWLIRNALVVETRDAQGAPDGRLFLLSTVPSHWYDEGQEIELEGFPTYYGTLDLHVRSRLESALEIEVSYHLEPNSVGGLKAMTVRLAPPGHPPRDLLLEPGKEGTARVRFAPEPSGARRSRNDP